MQSASTSSPEPPQQHSVTSLAESRLARPKSSPSPRSSQTLPPCRTTAIPALWLSAQHVHHVRQLREMQSLREQVDNGVDRQGYVSRLRRFPGQGGARHGRGPLPGRRALRS